MTFFFILLRSHADLLKKGRHRRCFPVKLTTFLRMIFLIKGHRAITSEKVDESIKYYQNQTLPQQLYFKKRLRGT